MNKSIESKITFSFKANQAILNLIAYIDSFKGRWQAIENNDNRYLNELKKIATIQSIGSSTRIEGATLSDEEISKLLKNVSINKLTTRDEQEVYGYYETLEIVHNNHSEINLSENYIKQLHSLLLKHSTKDARHKGKYKALSNKVVATYPDGAQKTIFNTTEPALVEKEMSEALKWTSIQLNAGEIHPLIVIGTFIYEFLSIHPFQDGNGRLSRLLTILLMLKNGYLFIQYVSLEHVIEETKQDYYKCLMECQKNRNTKNEKIDRWLIYFLASVKQLVEKLDSKYNTFRNAGPYLNQRQQDIFEIIQQVNPIKVGDIARKFPAISINTIKKDLKHLLSENVIEKIGEKRGTIYIPKNDATP